MTYNNLRQLKEKNFMLCFWIMLFVIIISLVLCYVDTYDTYDAYGEITNNGLIEISAITSNDSMFTEDSYIMFENQKYNYKVISSNSYVEQNMIISKYVINVNPIIKNRDIIKLTFYYNKEKMIKKIIKFIF